MRSELGATLSIRYQSISVHLTRGRSRWGFGDPPKELEFVLLPLSGTFLPYYEGSLDRYMYLYLGSSTSTSSESDSDSVCS